MNGKILVIMQSATVFGYLIFISWIDMKLQQQAAFTKNFYFYIIFGQLAYIPVGFLIGLQKFLRLWKKEGRFKWKKRYGVGFVVPCAYFLVVPYLLPVDSLFPYSMMTHPTISAVVQVVFGYYFMMSLDKD
ncbi:hypothetical protein SAMN05192559_10375 [Halobacillus karajensis]|uniref:hypothetical protein n=1 Tax=Halobacillus karajensis TaxID=195088 RepID=UPI0008A814AE|nr:hypothetical protein [Halobacillus karajensis]SEH68749.1 hypothetical protein SAMN05192559_10375 [Halobacillus karajensis]